MWLLRYSIVSQISAGYAHCLLHIYSKFSEFLVNFVEFREI